MSENNSKNINPLLLIDDLEKLGDIEKVSTYLSNRRGRKPKHLKELGISGGIPSFEICLRRNCEELPRCFDIVTHKLNKLGSCNKLKRNYVIKYAKGKHKASISHRDISLCIIGLRKLAPSDLNKDERVNYLITVLEELAQHTTDKAIITV